MIVVKKRKKGGKEESDQQLMDRFRKLSISHLKTVRTKLRYTKPSEEKRKKKQELAYRDELKRKGFE